MRDLYDVEQSNISFAALDSTDVVPMKIRQLCETLLGQAAFGPQLADAFAELHARVCGSHLPPC
jgi:hypothetical protein